MGVIVGQLPFLPLILAREFVCSSHVALERLESHSAFETYEVTRLNRNAGWNGGLTAAGGERASLRVTSVRQVSATIRANSSCETLWLLIQAATILAARDKWSSEIFARDLRDGRLFHSCDALSWA